VAARPAFIAGEKVFIRAISKPYPRPQASLSGDVRIVLTGDNE
jgi:hypothetical protein